MPYEWVSYAPVVDCPHDDGRYEDDTLSYCDQCGGVMGETAAIAAKAMRRQARLLAASRENRPFVEDEEDE